MRRDRASEMVIGLVILAGIARVAHAEDDPWAGLRPLIGKWEGTGAGFGTTSTVSHEWDLVLGDHFLRLQTRSVSVGKDGAEDVHEDVGYVSLDSDRRAYVFRQFLSEGFVNTYDLAVRAGENQGIEFSHREAESAGGMRAQMRLTFVGAEEYGLVLDLAPAGKDFVACQEMHLRRAGADTGAP